MCVSVCRRADVRTCVGHSHSMIPLFPSPVVSEWLIQRQAQSQTITSAWNDSTVSLGEVNEEKSRREGGRRWITLGGGGLKTQNNIREAVGTLKCPPPWLTLVWLALSSLPLSSCFTISSCNTTENGEEESKAEPTQAERQTHQAKGAGSEEASPSSPRGNHQWFSVVVKLPRGRLRVTELLHMVGMSWEMWPSFFFLRTIVIIFRRAMCASASTSTFTESLL